MVEPPVLSSVTLEREGPQSRLLVLLHGYGEDPDQLTERLHLIDPTGAFLVVVPGAPFEHRGRRIWFRAMTAREEAEAQLLASLTALDRLLGELERTHGLPADEAVVGGFSQGGGLALALLLGADVAHRPAAGFGVCSFPPTVRGFRVDRAAAAGRPFFLSSARGDHFAPIESSRAGGAVLVDAGLDLTYVEADGPHVMTDAAASLIGAWLGGERRGRGLLEGVEPAGSTFDGLWEHVTP